MKAGERLLQDRSVEVNRNLMSLEEKALQGRGALLLGRHALLICRSSKNFIKFLLFLSVSLILY
jgi:hypothetical protein